MNVSEEDRSDLRTILLTYFILIIVGTTMILVVVVSEKFNISIVASSLIFAVVMCFLTYWVWRGNDVAWFVSLLFSAVWFIFGLIEILKAYDIIPKVDENASITYALGDTLLGLLMMVLMLQPVVVKNCKS